MREVTAKFQLEQVNMSEDFRKERSRPEPKIKIRETDSVRTAAKQMLTSLDFF